MERNHGPDKDRLSIYAMASCGPGILDADVLTYIKSNYNMMFSRFVNNPNLKTCFENLLYSSDVNFKLIM